MKSLVTLAVVAALAVAGCGGSDSESTPAKAPAPAPAPAAKAKAKAKPAAPGGGDTSRFERCLNENGVEVPEGALDGGPPAGGTGDLASLGPEVQTALQACFQYAPQNGS